MLNTVTIPVNSLFKMDIFELVKIVDELQQENRKLKERVDGNKYLTKREACEVLKISVTTLDNLIKDGKLQARKENPQVKNSAVRILNKDLMDYINSDS